jgi:hypothetical protein
MAPGDGEGLLVAAVRQHGAQPVVSGARQLVDPVSIDLVVTDAVEQAVPDSGGPRVPEGGLFDVELPGDQVRARVAQVSERLRGEADRTRRGWRERHARGRRSRGSRMVRARSQLRIDGRFAPMVLTSASLRRSPSPPLLSRVTISDRYRNRWRHRCRPTAHPAIARERGTSRLRCHRDLSPRRRYRPPARAIEVDLPDSDPSELPIFATPVARLSGARRQGVAALADHVVVFAGVRLPLFDRLRRIAVLWVHAATGGSSVDGRAVSCPRRNAAAQ